jgi:uncharacterized membrane protein
MKQKKMNLILGLLAVVVLTLSACTPTGPAAVAGESLSAEDRTELLRLTLERALVAQEIPDYALLSDLETLVLSSENIDAAEVPALEGVDLVVLTPAEIQARANEEGDFPYLHFQELEVESADKVTVRLGSRWAIAEESDMLYLSGGGFAIEYTREGGSWVGEITEQWIS